MGYTHYWEFKSSHGKSKTVEATYQLAVRQCQRIIKGYNKRVKALDKKHPNRLAGYSAYTKISEYSGIDVNGTGDLGHETFSVADHYSKNRDKDFWGFCKTANKPYDAVVVACLLTLRYYLCDLITISSDGDYLDFVEGQRLAEDILKIKEQQRSDDIRKIKIINLSQGDWFIYQDTLYIKLESDMTHDAVEAISLDRHRLELSRDYFKNLKVTPIYFRDIKELTSRYK